MKMWNKMKKNKKKKKYEVNINASLYDILEYIGSTELENQNTVEKVVATSNETIDLPALSGWLLKSTSSILKIKIWHKRWVCVKRTHMLWSKAEQTIDDPTNIAERKKWRNSITLLTIIQVKKVSGSNDKCFDIITRYATYHFQAYTKEDRDHWVEGLVQHLRMLAKNMDFLNQSVLFNTGKGVTDKANNNNNNKNNNNNDNNNNDNNNDNNNNDNNNK